MVCDVHVAGVLADFRTLDYICLFFHGACAKQRFQAEIFNVKSGILLKILKSALSGCVRVCGRVTRGVGREKETTQDRWGLAPN